jgi:hypothetical protein
MTDLKRAGLNSEKEEQAASIYITKFEQTFTERQSEEDLLKSFSGRLLARELLL